MMVRQSGLELASAKAARRRLELGVWTTVCWDIMCVLYGKFPSVFSLEIHHGGKLSQAPNRLYDGGKVNWFDQIDSDGFSVVEVNQMLKCLGYLNPKMEYWYKMPDKDALLSLSNDNDVLRFIKYVDRYKLMQLYVVHPVDKPKPLGDNEVTEETFDPLFCDLDPETGEPNATEFHSEVPNVTEPSEVPNGPEPSEIPNDAEDVEDSDDSDFDVELEDMIEDVEVDMDDFRKYTDENVEWVGRNEVPVEDTQPVDAEVFEDLDLEDFDSASDPDDIECNRKKALRMLAKKHKPVDGNIYSEIFYYGQTFANKELIKQMVSRLVVENRRHMWLTKNDKIRIWAQCRGIVPTFSNDDGSQFGPNGPSGSQSQSNTKKGGKPKVVVKDSQSCPWVLHCSKSKTEESWYVKRLDDEHTCLQSRFVSKCTAKFLSKTVEETIKPNPKIPIAALKDQLQKKFELGVSRAKVLRAKQMAQDNVIGDYVNQFARLKDYALELQEQNPDTTIKIDVERTVDVTSETRKFRRIYVCLGALKSGFKAGKRDLLGLDGCFMSGPYPGQILTAVGVDPNNGTYPLAYAVVEAETKDSWNWFLDCLGDDLELARNSNFTFISDRQKGLIPALQEMFPAAEHRFCLKHIYDNMKLSWRGQQYKELLWKSATSPTVQLFERNMEELRMINKDVYDWLKKIPPHHWSRSHFSGRPHCDVLLNNMCEVLNRQLLDGRDKPIITCLEFIRQYLMKRIVAVQKVINKSNGPLTPTATKIFNNIKKEAAQITVLWNGGELYQATGPHGTQYVCNMTQRTCSCKKWELTGIPCKHAVACIWDMATNGQEPGIPDSWVSECYWLSTWQEMYSFKINPCNGPDMWNKSPSPITLTPSNYHTPIGRPQKKRKKSAAELFDGMVKNRKLSRAGKSVTCNKCGQVGHNNRSCKGLKGPQASQASVTPSAPTVSQSQTFVRPTPPLRPAAPSVRPSAPSNRQTPPFLRPTAPFFTPRFTKT
ncbi:mutator type transposase [Tanacetum coccineum]